MENTTQHNKIRGDSLSNDLILSQMIAINIKMARESKGLKPILKELNIEELS